MYPLRMLYGISFQAPRGFQSVGNVWFMILRLLKFYTYVSLHNSNTCEVLSRSYKKSTGGIYICSVTTAITYLFLV